MTSPPKHAVLARNLRKSYGDFEAVKGIDFEIAIGEAFGFLGPNGAGKSTTMRMIYRASPVGSGTLDVLGLDGSDGKNDRAIKRRIGVVHQENNLDEELTVKETLEVFCRFYRLKGAELRQRVEELMTFAELSDRANSKVIALSGGMKRRLMVARGMIGEPELVVLDEPTTGLDPRARQSLWEKLAALRRRNATLIVTTHYMDEAERLCDRIAIMDAGEIVAVDTPANLIATHAAPHVVEIDCADVEELGIEQDLRTLATHGAESFGGRLLLYGDDAERLMTTVVSTTGGRPAHLRRGTLEDVFLRITGRGLGGRQ
ncbi:MAG: lipooligosaccharide transport system ATP-binding protein [Bradymonadia bacterium]|jgi:lipooligosaccharide transport system ATP-binding protein